MTYLKTFGALAIAVAMAACSDDNKADAGTTTVDASSAIDGGAAAGTARLNFSVDDSTNKVFQAGDLQWKGSMIYDSATGKITFDGAWTGPYAPVYDDGPYTAGGHEPAMENGKASAAGDHIWGVSALTALPATGSNKFGYGLIDKKYGDAWLWVGPDGSFEVKSTDKDKEINVPGMTFAPYGTIDMRLTIDTNMLAAGDWDTSKVTVKGSAWGWIEVPITLTAGKGSILLSDNVGVGKTFAHGGLLKTGDKPEFIFVFNGKEYKDAVSMNAATMGVTAETKSGANFTTVAIMILEGKGNTYITVP